MAAQLSASVAYPAIVARGARQQDHPVPVRHQDLEVSLLGRHDITTLRPCRPDQQIHVTALALRTGLPRLGASIGMKWLLIRLLRAFRLLVTLSTSHAFKCRFGLGGRQVRGAPIDRLAARDASRAMMVPRPVSCAPTTLHAAPVAALRNDSSAALRTAAGASATLVAVDDLLNAPNRDAGCLRDLTTAEPHLRCLKDGSITLQAGLGEFRFGGRVRRADRPKPVENDVAEAASRACGP